MIRIRFPDTDSERKGLGYLCGRFSFTTRADGVTLVPDAALAALARKGIPFSAEGPATYEQIVATLRAPPAPAV